MAAAMTIENFFARQRHLHRTAGDHRKLADDDFVIERIALAAKAAAVWRGNHANVTGRQLQELSPARDERSAEFASSSRASAC